MPRRLATDALRNFKFGVSIAPPPGSNVPSTIRTLGFMTVDGLAMQTEVIPYREGGDNTTTRKMPGQTDFGPLTFAKGSMAAPVTGAGAKSATAGTNELYLWAGLIFSAMEGQGTGTTSGDFRTDIYIDIYEHPITIGHNAAGGSFGNMGGPIKLRFHVYNAWCMALSYSGLDAGGNGVFVESMQVAHEGFKPIYGSIQATGPQGIGYVPATAA